MCTQVLVEENWDKTQGETPSDKVQSDTIVGVDVKQQSNFKFLWWNIILVNKVN